MKNNKKKSYTPIRVAGSAAVVGMACLTALSVNAVLNYLNDEADREYWAAFNANKTEIVSNAPTDDSTLVAEVTEPVVTTVPTETVEPVTTEDPTITEDPTDTTIEEPTEEDPIEITEPDTTTDPDETDPGVEDGDKDADPEEPDDNHDDNSDNDVVVGKSFDLTGCSLDSAGNLVYTVQKGDCLSKIGRQFECDYREIGKINNIADLNLIHTGEKLIIPVSDEMMAYAKANLK